MRSADFDYPLPAERIAQEPLAERDASRLLHVVSDGGLEDREFRELPALLRPGDLLVVNATRVRRARLPLEIAAERLQVIVKPEARCLEDVAIAPHGAGPQPGPLPAGKAPAGQGQRTPAL